MHTETATSKVNKMIEPTIPLEPEVGEFERIVIVPTSVARSRTEYAARTALAYDTSDGNDAL